SQLLFYDAPTPPEGIFNEFLSIPAEEQDISTRSMLSLVQAAGNQSGFRTAYNTIPFLRFTPAILNAIINESEAHYRVYQFWSERLSPLSATLITYAVELFLPDFLSKQTVVTSAYPPTRAQPFLPFSMTYQWNDSSSDEIMRDAITQSAQHLTAVAVADGQNIAEAPLYGNYAIDSSPLSRIFGEQLPRLKDLKRRFDAEDVMGLAGGWKI
ncbi:hypothetical protein OBBRIDRAFT_742872, partial [Obba rivulosa]